MILRTTLKELLSSGHKYILFYDSSYPAAVYLFKVINRNIGTTCEICSNLTIKNREVISQLVLVFLQLTWNK